MAATDLQIITIILLFVGESLAIYSEIAGANKIIAQNKISAGTFLQFFVLITLAGVPLLFGYFIGIQVFKNIWIVSITSILSILIVEPVLAYVIFKQFPTNGALIGFVLGAVGLFATVFVK
jgi:hypothetical protein